MEYKCTFQIQFRWIIIISYFLIIIKLVIKYYSLRIQHIQFLNLNKERIISLPNKYQQYQMKNNHSQSLVWVKIFILISIILIVSCQSGKRTQQRPKSYIRGVLAPNQQITLEISVFNSTHQIFNTTHQTIYALDIQQKLFKIPVQIFQDMDNLTMTATLLYRDLYTSAFIQAWRGQANLTKFKKITKLNSQEFFATGELGSTSSQNQKGNYTLHIAEDFNIMIVYSDMAFPGHDRQLFTQMNFQVTQFQFNGIEYQAKYLPKLDISQMHIPYKYYKPINGLLNGNGTNSDEESEGSIQIENQQKENREQLSILENNNNSIIKTHVVTLHIYPYSIVKYIMFFQMFDPVKRQEAMKINPMMQYLMDDEGIDDMKELLFTNNLYIVGLTLIMTFAKSILQIFALKNEFKIWNQIQKNKGLSLKILYTDLGFQLIFFLYLVDNQSNLMVTVPMVIGMLVVLWKIKKTIYVQKLNSFPYIKLKHYDWCRHHQKIDSQGVKYMYYGLGVLFVGYIAYQIIISSSFSNLVTYSSILQKVVFFMGMAGFIRMTPQIYINYKLKSVDHLPWKTLIYRFIETIIDDFYVFLVTTPILHKVMVFRQDVIFLLYIYQRMIYRVDPNRIGTAGGMVLQKQQIDKALSNINTASNNASSNKSLKNQ